MSLAPRFSIQPQTPINYKYSLALHILNNVAPKIMDKSQPFTLRLALARAWRGVVESLAPDICEKYCGGASGGDGEWGWRELDAVSQALVAYAASALRDVLSQSRHA